MAGVDDIRRTFREFRRYTGDGLPNAPLSAPLPIGDPSSGPHSPIKADIRDAFDSLSTEMDAAVDAAELARDLAISAAGTNLINFTTKAAADVATINGAITYVITAGFATVGDGGGAIYKKLGSTPSPVRLSHFQSTDGAWWEYVPGDEGYNVLAFGADPTFATNTQVAIQGAMDAAPTGSVIYFPKGEYKISANLAFTDKALSFVGQGPDQSIIRAQSCGGIYQTLTAQPALDTPWTMRVRGLSITTNNTSDVTDYCALKTAAPNLVDDGGASQLGMVVDDCIFDGQERFNHWWPTSVYVRNVQNNRINRCFSYSKANTTKGFGFVFSGHSTSCYVTDCELYFNEIAIQQDGDGYTNWASEGLVVVNSAMKASVGIKKTHSAVNGEPQLQVFGCHINARAVGIYTINAYEIQISDCLIYLQATALETIDANPICIALGDTSAGGTNTKFAVRGTQMRCLASAGDYTISRGILADMSVGLIDACTFQAFTRGIEIATTRTTIHVGRNNRYVSNTANILNSGTSNTQDAATVAL